MFSQTTADFFVCNRNTIWAPSLRIDLRDHSIYCVLTSFRPQLNLPYRCNLLMEYACPKPSRTYIGPRAQCSIGAVICTHTGEVKWYPVWTLACSVIPTHGEGDAAIVHYRVGWSQRGVVGKVLVELWKLL